MNLKAVVALLCFQTFTSFVQAQNIQFDSTIHSWEQAIYKADSMQKPVFVDVYTILCALQMDG